MDGVPIERRSTKPPFDTSNGWLLNHPLMKVRLYCEHLDEVRETSLEATMRRLMGGDAAEAQPEVAARIALDDFIVPDGDVEPGPRRAKGAAKTKAKAKGRAVPAAKAGRQRGAGGEVDDDDDEDVPLAKRARKAK